jgi:hypothetical protein
MVEERLLLIFSYLLISGLLLMFCFYTSFSKKIKLCGVVFVTAFYFLSWNTYTNLLGWPSAQDLPEEFRIIWVVIEEPKKETGKEGGLYLWVRLLDEAKIVHGKPRAYKLEWSEENYKKAQFALLKLKEGEQLNGKKTYGVINKDKEGDKANLYESQGEQEEGVPSFEFEEIPARTLPPKTLILN